MLAAGNGCSSDVAPQRSLHLVFPIGGFGRSGLVALAAFK
jgi:hypothetical protein